MQKPDWKVWIKSKKECRKWYETYRKKQMLRKTTLKPENYMAKATHNMDFANWLLDKHKDDIPSLFGDQKFYDWAIVAFYYAIYHASLALIATKGMSSKSHAATLSAIILFFYHEKKISKEDVEMLADTPLDKGDIETIVESKDLRERASYNVGYEFDEALVKKAKENAVKFTEKVRNILSA